MHIEHTPIEGLLVVTPDVFGDDRGSFFESYNEEKFAALGLPTTWRQDNHSESVKGVLRGLHFQLLPRPMAKLVRCVKGKVWDVAVDLRKGSPTYKQHVAVELTPENKKMFLIPEGFGHGFYCLEDSMVLYKSSNAFVKELDANVAWNDPELNVPWPLEGEPILSGRDQIAPKFADLDLLF